MSFSFSPFFQGVCEAMHEAKNKTDAIRLVQAVIAKRDVLAETMDNKKKDGWLQGRLCAIIKYVMQCVRLFSFI